MNYFDDYYTDPQPEESRPNYIPPEQPRQPQPKKERKGMRRAVSALPPVFAFLSPLSLHLCFFTLP